MKVLIIKMSSMGDIIHIFPALTDAGNAIKNIRFDWIVEESFQELPTWHPLVDNVFPVAMRRWRKQPLKTLLHNEIPKMLKKIRKERYDYIIDAQGLLKSSIISSFCRGVRCSYDRCCARESWANFIYQKKYNISTDQHAVQRGRELFAKSLNYSIVNSTADYGLNRDHFSVSSNKHTLKKYMLFLPNTTWNTKHWPDEYWEKLIGYAVAAEWDVELPWGNANEKARVEKLAAISGQVRVLPRMSLTDVANRIAGAQAVVALDTGLAHVAAALSTPTLSLYGPTDPKITGTLGGNQKHMAAVFDCAPCFQRRCSYPDKGKVNPPCFSTLPPEQVWKTLQAFLV